MIRAHRIRLNPTREQASYLRQACGVSRFVFNGGLAEWRRQYEAGEKPSAMGLKKQFNAIKREQFPFVMDVLRDASNDGFEKLGKAFSNFFASVKGKRNGVRVGYPRFKSKKQWACSGCGTIHDRDWNAAKNIEMEALRLIA